MASTTNQGIKSNSAIVLVVEDNLTMLAALRDILEGEGYQVRTASHGEAALESFLEARPALILSDISMPIMNGFELFEAIRAQPGGIGIPFIFLTARTAREDVSTGKSLGADDYITKPIRYQELLDAVRARLKRSDELLVEQMKIAYKDSLFAFANAIELRDPYTYNHVLRINAYALAMAKELGWDEARREVVEFGAILHDIGKLEVNLSILSKKEELTPEEWEEMHRHPEFGVIMIKKISYLAPAVPMILHHHENWDGSGYPGGLIGEDIPEEARLLAIVDSFDAMTTDRPYREAISPELAYEEILSRSGVQFDPAMVEIFTRCWEQGEIQRIMREMSDHKNDEMEGENLKSER